MTIRSYHSLSSFRLKPPVQLEEITSDGFDRNVPRGEEGLGRGVGEWGVGGGKQSESTEYRIRKFYSVRSQPRLKGCKLNNTPFNTMHTVLKLLTLECCKPKRNRMYRRIVMITFLPICSFSSSSISHLQVLHERRIYLLLNPLYPSKARFFRACSFCVTKSNANKN